MDNPGNPIWKLAAIWEYYEKIGASHNSGELEPQDTANSSQGLLKGK